MSVALTKGGNVSLSRQAPGLRTVRVCLGWTAGAGYDLDASALLCGASGKVLTDQHFVFFNNLQSPDGSVRHQGGNGGGEDRERIDVRLADVSADVERIVFPVAIYDAAQRRQSFGQVRGAYIRLVDADGGGEVARYDVAPEAGSETAMVFGELYRHGADWKFRAVGQGYASGLAGIATDFGVDVLQPAPAAAPAPVPAPVSAPAVPAVPPPVAPPVPKTQPVPGSSPVTCFFDPSHGPGSTAVLWQPQWGVPRQVETCAACAQRVQTTVPPFYTPPQGYPQAGYAQPGYPQAGYPQPVQQGHPQAPGQPEQGGRRFGTGAMIGAGAAGLVGGVLLNEALSDDGPEVVVNNYYESDDDGFF
ncbi:TerD family protein [Kitasatospora sp. SUK 42]|uniref:TerD family protein n=1 Tax=Kitasatospora sp. SUK 42 TaxID=1588882 RepID=UPI0018CBC648|nr:TerD family protein [Kitasatospora sp. SUK 42]MBV2154996.1 TerD family protein [Kitasatospora sp. SUK 42]